LPNHTKFGTENGLFGIHVLDNLDGSDLLHFCWIQKHFLSIYVDRTMVQQNQRANNKLCFVKVKEADSCNPTMAEKDKYGVIANSHNGCTLVGA
jgi:hypothetical protein